MRVVGQAYVQNRTLIVTSAIAFICGGAPGVAQPATRTISGAPACAQCRVSVRPGSLLGDTDGQGSLGANGVYGVVRFSDSVVVLLPRGELPQLHTESGRYLRTLGRVGDGPGEFRRPFALLREGDSIYRVLDAGQTRQSWFRYDGTFIRSEPFLAGPARKAVLAIDGTVLVTASLNSPAQIGLPLHRIGKDGRVVQSLGLQYAVNRSTTPADYRQHLRVTSTGDIVTVHELDYRIQVRKADGALVADWRRDVPWFVRSAQYRGPSLDNPPDSYVEDIIVDKNQRLWVLITRGHPRWKDGLGPTQRDGSGQAYQPVEDPQLVYRSTVEVFDLRTGRLLVSSDLPAYFQHLVDERTLAQEVESAEARPVVRLWSVVGTFR